jgi:hypothetical protein
MGQQQAVGGARDGQEGGKEGRIALVEEGMLDGGGGVEPGRVHLGHDRVTDAVVGKGGQADPLSAATRASAPVGDGA